MARRSRFALLLAASAAQAGALRHPSRASQGAAGHMSLEQLRSYGFRDFVAEYGRKYEEGSVEYLFRETLFNDHKKHVVEFREGPEQSWQIGVNNFMDFTEAEKRAMLGYKGSRSRKASDTVTFQREAREAPVPLEFNVKRRKSTLVDLVRDQGSCGSCWAHAAVSTLEGQLEVAPGVVEALRALRKANASLGLPEEPVLSGQTIVSCTANPRNCGGTGGCGGATVELAYDMIHENGGLPFQVDWPYESGSGSTPECRTGLFQKSRISIDGYTALPSNHLHPLKLALVTSGGPIAVSVDATNWFLYWSGIYSDADSTGDFRVNHAVTLVGYSEPRESKQGFWRIKNSWGQVWGENGYIRVEMKANEEKHCGWDHKAHEGVACDGDPDDAWVCGTCGILYDSVYPTGVHLK